MLLALSPRLQKEEKLYIGIDIGKTRSVAAFNSRSLLQNKHYKECPHFSFSQDRSGFEELLTRMQQYAPLGKCQVLLELTGNYHRTLQQYLAECGVAVYTIAVQVKPRHKSDKQDALLLANLLYNQIELSVQAHHGLGRIEPAAEASPLAKALRGLSKRHLQLSVEITRRKNNLTSILDEVFPEFVQGIKDPNGQTALMLRRLFPTAQAFASADPRSVNMPRYPGQKGLRQLIELAKTSVGTRDAGRLESLVFTQRQLIDELELLCANQKELDDRISDMLPDSREVQILRSIGILAPSQIAAVLAFVTPIQRFRNKATLKSFFGWAPKTEQSGTTLNKSTLTRGGNRVCRNALYMAAWNAVNSDTEWKALYWRLVPRMCARMGDKFKGKNKAIAFVAGRILGTIWSLLHADYELLQATPAGEEPPPPRLYDRTLHQAAIRRHGLKSL